MDINYSYKILSLEAFSQYNGMENVVTRIHFEYNGTDNESGFSGTCLGACPLQNPEQNNFILFSSLTEEDIINWVKEYHPISPMQEIVIGQIQKQINSFNREIDFPWSN